MVRKNLLLERTMLMIYAIIALLWGGLGASTGLAAESDCANGIDDDDDFYSDCLDSDCATLAGGYDYQGYTAYCEYATEITCDDGFDNDGDGNGYGDCADQDCDGKIGYDANTTYFATCEWGMELSCDDYVDNDADGYLDCDDPDCDLDNDSICKATDNCPDLANSGQEDNDGDRIGDLCDDDIDGDGIDNAQDNCPESWNPNQENADGDGLGNICDDCTDTDGDNYGDPEYALFNTTCSDDNCPYLYNPDQLDLDNDSVGDACDECSDSDGDGYGDPSYRTGYTTCLDDNCPYEYNGFQYDSDLDGIGDVCDSCSDYDNDSYGDPLLVTPYTTCLNDCDDTKSTVYPGANEYCNGFDDDCDGQTDENDALDVYTWYRDGDHDSYGDGSNFIFSCDPPVESYVSNHDDCDDNDATKYPWNTELCDGKDNDCNSMVDDGLMFYNYYPDCDNDSYGDSFATVIVACQDPNLSPPPMVASRPSCNYLVEEHSDCDDTQSSIYPMATELCNGVDDDCDGDTDEDDASDAKTWYQDSDNDSYAVSSMSQVACYQPSGYILDSSSMGEDCDDSNSMIYPGATEYCNGSDDNCDGNYDENTATDAQTWYQDFDNDSYAVSSMSQLACYQPSGYILSSSSMGEDCDDSNPTIHPYATEYCNTYDDDCDGAMDESDAADVQPWYQDSDNDTYGDANTTTNACSAPNGYVSDNSDCNDMENSIYPGALEQCNNIDDDCDGNIDNNVQIITFYVDSDGDGFGNPSISTDACQAPNGYVVNSDDCDDTNASINPYASEVCDEVDNNCDGNTDEDVQITYYYDWDGDGYGDATSSVAACNSPSNYVSDNNDCDDYDPNNYPGNTEVCDDKDNDCNFQADDGLTFNDYYPDCDGDSYGDMNTDAINACKNPFPAQSTQSFPPTIQRPCYHIESEHSDCNDWRAESYPGATEYCNGEDDNCDGETDENSAVNASTWYRDIDGDGYGDPSSPTTACTVPDGYVSDSSDCDDTNLNAWTNCSTCHDNDGDTYYQLCDSYTGINGPDCDDADANNSPGNSEVCDHKDNDCDGQADNGLTFNNYYPDCDLDGYGDQNASATSDCQDPASSPPPGTTSRPSCNYVIDSSTDCNDADNSIYPGVPEQCNNVDDDCDGNIDNNVQIITFYADADGDGFGNPANSTDACKAPDGYVINSDDCDDTQASIYPFASEVCDEIDNDCNGATDEGVQITYYFDGDADTYGDPNTTILACSIPGGYVSNSTDCNDSNAILWNQCESPESTCNDSLDNDDNGSFDCADLNCAGQSGPSGVTCCQSNNDCGGGGATCDTTNYICQTSSQEVVCNDQADNDSDGLTDCDDPDCAGQSGPSGVTCCQNDGDCAASSGVCLQWYRDCDTDSYGDPAVLVNSCTQPSGSSPSSQLALLAVPRCNQPNNYVADNTDCNDYNDSINPGASELCNGQDDNCEGQIDEGLTPPPADQTEGVCAGQVKICFGSGGWIEPDYSGILGYESPESSCDGQDNDCNGQIDENVKTTYYLDSDGDSYGHNANSLEACSPPKGYADTNTDCDDTNSGINPGATELCSNSIDDDCDQSIDEQDCQNMIDSDNDNIADDTDNCANQFNPDQADQDTDGFGDICDSTTDIPDPVALWQLNESVGTDISDSANMDNVHNDGTVTNPDWIDSTLNEFFNMPIGSGSAIYFDGDTDAIDVPDNATLDLAQAITLEGWVSSNLTGSTTAEILSKGNAYGLQMTDQSVIAHIGNNSLQADNVYNTWNHLALTYDKTGGSNNFRLYINGLLRQQATLSSTIPVNDLAVLLGDKYQGALDDLAIFKHALSPAEIQKRWAAVSGYLIGRWQFDTGYGTFDPDSAGMGNHAALNNGPLWVDSTIHERFDSWYDSGDALDFDGSDDYVSVPSSPRFDFGTEPFAIEAWVRTISTSNDWQGLVSRDNTSTGFWLQLTPAKYLAFGWNDSNYLVGDEAINDGEWHHIFAQRTGPTTAEIYIDGHLDARSTSLPAESVNNNQALHIGRFNAASGLYFDGQLDEVGLYSQALDPWIILQKFETFSTYLIGKWDFNEPNQNDPTAQDLSGNYVDGTISGAARANSTLGSALGGAPTGWMMNFNGSNARISLPEFGYYWGFVSAEAWIKTNTSQPGWADILAGTNGDIRFGLYSNRLAFGVQGDSTNAQTVLSSGTLNDNTWHHVVGTYDYNQLCLFIDGKPNNCKTLSEFIFTPGVKAIGSNANGSAEFFAGSLDNVAMYDNALAPIYIEYKAGLIAQSGWPVARITPNKTTAQIGEVIVLNGNGQSNPSSDLYGVNPGIANYFWNLDDGTPLFRTAESNVSVSYSTPGVKKVQLWVTDLDGNPSIIRLNEGITYITITNQTTLIERVRNFVREHE